MTDQKFVAAVEEFVKRLEGEVPESPNARKVATILLCSLLTGPDVGQISKLTGYSEPFVSAMGTRLYQQGVWSARGVSFPSPDEDYGLPFWLLVYDLVGPEGESISGPASPLAPSA